MDIQLVGAAYSTIAALYPYANDGWQRLGQADPAFAAPIEELGRAWRALPGR